MIDENVADDVVSMMTILLSTGFRVFRIKNKDFNGIRILAPAKHPAFGIKAYENIDLKRLEGFGSSAADIVTKLVKQHQYPVVRKPEFWEGLITEQQLKNQIMLETRTRLVDGVNVMFANENEGSGLARRLVVYCSTENPDCFGEIMDVRVTLNHPPIFSQNLYRTAVAESANITVQQMSRHAQQQFLKGN